MTSSIHSIGTCLKTNSVNRIGDAIHNPRQIHKIAKPTHSRRIHPRQIHKLASRAADKLKRRIVHEIKIGRMAPVSQKEMAAWGL